MVAKSMIDWACLLAPLFHPHFGSFPCIPGVYWEKYWVSQQPSAHPCTADIGCHTSPSSTYMQTQPPFPLSWTTNSQYPGTTPISHVWKSEHIFVIITHLVLELTAGFAEGGRFDERETAALVLVVSQTWGEGGCEHMRLNFIIGGQDKNTVNHTQLNQPMPVDAIR